MSSIRLELSYLFDVNTFENYDRLLDKIAARYNGENVASGAGFGARDIVYEFKDPHSMVNAKTEMKQLPIEFVDFS